MLKALFFTAMAVTLALTMSYADQPKGKLVIPVQKTDPTNGKVMFTSYCAPCHGADGRGNGPAAGALKTQPTDLTGLAKAHHGKYPDNHIVSVLRFGTDVRAHGSAQMPVWGQIFTRMSKLNTQEKDLRTANLSRYLETLQVK
jgi:mono/diheme cytochrome c family protein